MTCTPLFSSLPSSVFIRSESAKLECEQHEERLVLFNACSFVAGGPSLRRVVGLVRPAGVRGGDSGHERAVLLRFG